MRPSDVFVVDKVLPDHLFEMLQRSVKDGPTSESPEQLILDMAVPAWFDLETPPSSIFEKVLVALASAVIDDRRVRGAEWWLRILPGNQATTWHYDADMSSIGSTS